MYAGFTIFSGTNRRRNTSTTKTDNRVSPTHLETILDALSRAGARRGPYLVPNVWRGPETGVSETDPVRHFTHCLETLLEREPVPQVEPAGDGSWTRESVVYNLFVRLTTAFDHDGDGVISPDPLPGGFRETGTFLKSISLLPYIERLGVNTIYLLPVTAPGEKKRKGNLGSPYAVRNPCTIDPLLGEPALGLEPETEFMAFVEAAHLVGMRVVQEFVFRTTSVDSDWIAKHPDWYYWLRTAGPDRSVPETYAPPEFDPETLATIYEKVDKRELSGLPAPSAAYRARFTESPKHVELSENGYTGAAPGGGESIVATAFSDWPPDDRQPPWTDVAYLKMHRHPEFNYVAYNTIRMYAEELDRPEYRNRALWDAVTGIIPFFQDTFGIDGAMIDMGHALPGALKSAVMKRAREKNPRFAFWDEDFDPSPARRGTGVDAVFGSLPFVIQDPVYIRGLLNYLNRTGVGVPFFGTGENHNTPRICHNLAGIESGRNRSRFIFGLASVLPAIPFIHSGMEICESNPVNLGLNFTAKDRERWGPEMLPLFSARGYDWKTCNGLEPLHAFIARLLAIRSGYRETVLDGSPGSIVLPFVSSPEMLAVMRTGERQHLLFVGNSDHENSARGFMEFQKKSFTLTDMVSGVVHTVTNSRLELDMDPGGCVIFDVPAQQDDSRQ